MAQKLNRALGDQERGTPLPPEQLTVEAFLTDWLASSAKGRLAESTYHGYETIVKSHIVPTIGKVRLAKLTPAQLQRLYRDKLDAGLAPVTVVRIHKVLSSALSEAERHGRVSRNVAKLVQAPRIESSKALAFSVDQAKAFMEQVAGDRMYAAYMVALAAGLRRGELLALEWEDVDLVNSSLAVRHSLMKVAGGWRSSDPKTRGSRRVVKLPAFAVEALKAHRTAQLEERLASPVWEDPNLVFTTSIGTLVDGRNFLRQFKAHAKAAGMPATFTIHSLRHSAATLMLALGVQPKVVQEMLGHSRIAVTMDLYSHVLPHLQDEAAAKMGALLASAN
ncbi:hypothetical protein AYO38_02650 [bacterium SCGC AG-212-C10]|nr:hypothetical protein AYO38_02650 [bacterium SCGC AG-212-C10]